MRNSYSHYIGDSAEEKLGNNVLRDDPINQHLDLIRVSALNAIQYLVQTYIRYNPIYSVIYGSLAFVVISVQFSYHLLVYWLKFDMSLADETIVRYSILVLQFMKGLCSIFG